MLSVPHMIVVFIVVLVVFGPQKLPELARTFGKLMAEFRKASGDFKSAFEEEMRDLERQTRLAELKRQTLEAAAVTSPATLASPAGAATAQPEATGDTRATEAPMTPIIAPVAESVPRLDAQPAEWAAETPTEAAPQSDNSNEPVHHVDPVTGIAHRATSASTTSEPAPSNSAEPDPNPSHDQQPA